MSDPRKDITPAPSINHDRFVIVRSIGNSTLLDGDDWAGLHESPQSAQVLPVFLNDNWVIKEVYSGGDGTWLVLLTDPAAATSNSGA